MTKSVDPRRARALLDLLESTLRRSGATVREDREADLLDREALDRAIIVDALRVVDGDPSLPPAAEVRIYLRPGRRHTRVFWAPRGSDGGSILHFVEQATGRVFSAQSSTKVGAPTGRVVDVAREADEPVGERPSLAEVLRRAERLTPQKVFAGLGMPKATRSGRERRSGVQVRKQSPKAVSVEWADWAGEGEDVRRQRFDEVLERLAARGYGFHLLSGEVGQAALDEARARRIVIVHRPKEAAPSVSSAPEKTPDRAPSPPRGATPEDLAKALELARSHGRAVVQLGQVYFDAPRGEGARTLQAFRTVLAGAVEALRAMPVLQRRVFVDEVKPAYRDAAALARSIQGEGWREGGEALLRRGTHARVFTEDLDRAFKALEVPRRYVDAPAGDTTPTGDTPAPAASAEARGEEAWERDRVVWFRPVDKGHAMRRVELRRGETAWVTLGRSATGERRGFWASVNGLSKARRQLKMNTQWVDLPFVFSRTEMEGEVVPPPPEGEASAEAGGPFTALLEALRTGKARALTIVSTDATPHRMRVARVESRPGALVAEGKVKRSKATLTIWTEVDDEGRPTKYARLERGSRGYRVDARRIAAPALKTEAPSPAPTPTALAPERGETEHQRRRRERAEHRAARLEREADAQLSDARGELDRIPPGQPILVGHHSERRHRKALERHDRKTRQALDTARAAEAAKGTAGRAGYAISSDDPDAVEALEARLAELEAARALSTAVNAAYRKGGWEAVEQVPGVTPKLLAGAKRTLELAPWMKTPMDTKNVGANIRRVRGRIEELRAAAERAAAPPIEGEGFSIEEDVDDNRVRFRFDERPERETTAKMKRAGFRWSRRHGAWQRQLNEAGRFAARRMAEELFGWQEPEPARTDESASDDVEAAARWQAQVKADHAALMERRAREEAEGRPPPRLSDEQVFDELRARAAITDEDRARYPGDVIEEAEASGLRPERVLELRAMSEREESEMGQRLRGAARRGDL
ncbi:MAG: DUF3560 domain-containing protein [Sandaracinaceae bacterium]